MTRLVLSSYDGLKGETMQTAFKEHRVGGVKELLQSPVS